MELGGGSPVQVDFERQLNSLTALVKPIYQHAHGPMTVRHLGLKIKGAVHAGVLPAHRSGPRGTLLQATGKLLALMVSRNLTTTKPRFRSRSVIPANRTDRGVEFHLAPVVAPRTERPSRRSGSLFGLPCVRHRRT